MRPRSERETICEIASFSSRQRAGRVIPRFPFFDHSRYPPFRSGFLNSIVIVDSFACRESGDRGSMFLSGRSPQQSDANRPSVEVYASVSSTLKHQRCRNLCLWKFVSLHPICKIEFCLRSECFLSIREYASYYRLPLWRTGVGQYIELETLPYLNLRLHLNSLYVLSF